MTMTGMSIVGRLRASPCLKMRERRERDDVNDDNTRPKSEECFGEETATHRVKILHSILLKR